jgi:hypothetical protein
MYRFFLSNLLPNNFNCDGYLYFLIFGLKPRLGTIFKKSQHSISSALFYTKINSQICSKIFKKIL